MKENNPISLNDLAKLNKKYLKNNQNMIVRHALVSGPLENVSKSADHRSETRFAFSVDNKTMPATNQKSSGRCWIFAATNLLREIIAKRCKITNFELSQSYLALYDKLEKINYALETIIDLLGCEDDDRTLQFVLKNGVGDGGQWDMFVNLVKKYGLVPKSAMDESYISSATHSLNTLINFNISRFASEARLIYQEKGILEVRALQKQFVDKCYTLLLNSYGKPLEKFAFEYVDSNDKYHLVNNLTPLKFYEKYVGDALDNYVSLINAPTKDKPFYRSFTIQYLGNVVEGKIVRHLNLPMTRIKELIIETLKNGELVWFGSDVAYYRDREKGIWDDQSFDYQTPFSFNYTMNKGDSLTYRASAMNHAMVITGVNLIKDKPTKWKIQNSWGTTNGESGYYIMSDTWFDQFVYQAVIDRKYLSREENLAYDREPIVLKPWDPMGSLAD
ncbi:MAG: C1 family peptidase [Bacilli bacterium]